MRHNGPSKPVPAFVPCFLPNRGFFHPVAHWACARIRLERELACDQLAMALSGGNAADYALVLVQVVSHA